MCLSKHAILGFLLQQPSVSGVRLKDLLDFVSGRLETDLSSADAAALQKLLSKLKRKWSSAGRTKKTFMKQNQRLLNVEFCLSKRVCRPASAGSSTRRRSAPFQDKCRRSKLRATEDLRREPSRELVFAAASNMHQEGHRKTAQLVEAVASPRRGPRLSAMLKTAKRRRQLQPYTPEEALALFIDLGLSKAQYLLLRKEAKARGADIYPSYTRVRRSKAPCMPAVEEMVVTPVCAEVRLKALLEHTTERLLEMQKEVVTSLQQEKGDRELSLRCFYKWGLDGSSGHTKWKQAGGVDDDQVVVTSLVPLRLTTEDGTVVWTNRTPNSPRFCRPLAVKFAKETQPLVLAEKEKVDMQVADLAPLRRQSVTCSYDLQMTMVDGKVVNTLTETRSAQTCSMCGVTPKNVNDLDAVRRLPVTNLEYGLSSLHCWIRVYEALLHISYRLPFKQWQLRKEEHRQAARQAKADVQQRMLDTMGLRGRAAAGRHRQLQRRQRRQDGLQAVGKLRRRHRNRPAAHSAPPRGAAGCELLPAALQRGTGGLLQEDGRPICRSLRMVPDADHAAPPADALSRCSSAVPAAGRHDE